MLKMMMSALKNNEQSLKVALKILLIILFILINIAIWRAGNWLEVSGNKPLSSVSSRLLFISLFSLTVMAVWGIKQWKKLRNYIAEQEKNQEIQKDPAKQSIEQQNSELRSIKSLLRQNINKRNYLYALPWYLMIGDQGSGKSSLIKQSGQKFLFSTEYSGFDKSGDGSRYINWWVSDKAVLIDPDGKLMTQGESAETDELISQKLWFNFIEWLEATRRRRPLNGLIITLDLAYLVTANSTERRSYANQMRTRIRELTESLSTRLPVYIALTKFDLLYGFDSYFKHCLKEDREEVFGFTFSLDSVREPDKWLSEFDLQYSGFIERLNRIFSQKASDSMTTSERNAIYSFTRQLAGVKSIFSDVLCDLFVSDQFTTTALVRGVYFTSVYQQGVPTNVYNDVSASRYGLSHAINRAQIAKSSNVFFTPKLFSQIIYPEAGLAGDNFRLVKQKRRVMSLSVAVCIVATVLLTGTWHRYYKSNVASSDAVLTKVNHYKEQFPSQIKLSSITEILEPLNKIREATLEFGFFRDKAKYVSEFGLYQGHLIGPKVEDTYLNLLEKRFLPLLMADVIYELKQAESDEDKLAALRVYRMMSDKSGRYDSYVLDYFSKHWQNSYPGQKHIQEKLLEHLEYAMQHTDLTHDRLNGDRALDETMRPYDKVIAKVQVELGAMPNDQRVYRNMKLSARTVLGPDINLRNMIGPMFDVVFEERLLNSDDLLIPRMLTKSGFEEFFMPQSESISRLALIDGWVLGQSKSAKFSEADKLALKSKIRDLYIADYTATWRAALNDVNIKYFSDINDAAVVLDSLTGNMEPLQRLLRSLDTHTRLFSTVSDDAGAKGAMVKSAKFMVRSRIEEPFADLTVMLRADNGKPAYFNEVLALVGELESYLKAIQEAPNSGMAALKAAKERILMESTDPIYTLQRVASGLPEPLDSMMTKLADETWYVVKQEAIKHLELRWQEDVYNIYQEKLAGRYPLNPASKKDVSLKDFEQFFAPEGVIDSFYHNQLKIFLRESSTLSQQDSEKALIREDVLNLIEHSQIIRDAFFNRKGVLDVDFHVEPLRLTNNKRRSVLNIDGQTLVYSHGQREGAELIWPNTFRESAVSKITLVPVKYNLSPRSLSIRGPWAFFRLLDKGSVISASPTTVDYKFAFEGGEMVYRIHSEEDSNPFTEPLFKSFKVSKTLY